MNVTLFPGTDRELLEVLRSCDARVVPVNNDGLTALSSPHARQPDVLVIDHRPGGALPPSLGLIRRQHPATGVMLVLPGLDASLMLEAMRAGINECVTRPLNVEDVRAALDRITSNRPAPRGGEVFAFIGAKGGVGATTVAVNAAATLAKLKPKSTLLIDLHLTYGDAGVYLGAEPRFSIVDALENMHRMDATFLRTLVTTTKSGVHLLPSSDHQVGMPLDVARVRSLIELASVEYPYVVLDVPRSDAVMLDALKPAGTIIMVSNQELASVRSAGRMATSMEQRYSRDRVSVVISRYTEGGSISQKDIERVVGRPLSCVFHNRVGDYQMAVESQARGEPLAFEHNSPLGRAIVNFTHTLANIAVDDKADKKSGVLSRFALRR